MSKKLYVGNLSYTTTNESLNTLFSEFGTVTSAEVVMDKFSGRSKGFGFVEMSDDAAAAAAIQGLSDKDVEGRAIKVNEARPKTDSPRGGGDRRPSRGPGGGGGGGGGYGDRNRRSW